MIDFEDLTLEMIRLQSPSLIQDIDVKVIDDLSKKCLEMDQISGYMLIMDLAFCSFANIINATGGCIADIKMDFEKLNIHLGAFGENRLIAFYFYHLIADAYLDNYFKGDLGCQIFNRLVRINQLDNKKVYDSYMQLANKVFQNLPEIQEYFQEKLIEFKKLMAISFDFYREAIDFG